MVLNYVLTILDRDRQHQLERVYKSMGLKFSLTMLGRGTASPKHLSMNGLSPTEKSVSATIATAEQTKALVHACKEKLYIDIPGNGILVSIPLKSIGGASILSQMTDGQPMTNEKPDLQVKYELIYVILNEGHSDEVMDAARSAGAGGGTVISAKGTGASAREKFSGLSLVAEKDVVLIVARTDIKAAIMKAIMEQAGTQTRAGAVCFSLPVTQVAGLREMDED